MSVVKALAHCRSGKAILEFRNDTGSPITVRGTMAGRAEVGAATPLLTTPLELRPGESKEVDVSVKMAELYVGSVSGSQTQKVLIRLDLDPEPGEQQGACEYTAVFENGRFVQFS